MRIYRAFCLEMGSATDIYQARDFFRSLPIPRKRFHFLCSDESCRALNTQVTGVNYDKLVDNPHFVKPHFREKDQHLPNCEWVLLSLALPNVEITYSGDTDITSEFHKRISQKSSNVVDLFLPPGICATNKVASNVQTRNGKREVASLMRRLNPNRTSFLTDVVSSFLLLGSLEQRTKKLKIGTVSWRSYRECFRPIECYGRSGRDQDFIFFGNISGRKVDAAFRMFFYGRPWICGRQSPVCLEMDEKSLVQDNRRYLLRVLDYIVAGPGDGEPATCYFYGKLQRDRENDSLGGLRVLITHRDNLVFTLKSKPRK